MLLISKTFTVLNAQKYKAILQYNSSIEEDLKQDKKNHSHCQSSNERVFDYLIFFFRHVEF